MVFHYTLWVTILSRNISILKYFVQSNSVLTYEEMGFISISFNTRIYGWLNAVLSNTASITLTYSSFFTSETSSPKYRANCCIASASAAFDVARLYVSASERSV